MVEGPTANHLMPLLDPATMLEAIAGVVVLP
jgi:hypothetical protein